MREIKTVMRGIVLPLLFGWLFGTWISLIMAKIEYREGFAAIEQRIEQLERK